MKTKTKKIDQAIVNKIVTKFNGKLLSKKNGNAERIEFWKVVNYTKENSGEITVLDGCFKYKDGMQGCTGSKFDIISKAEYKERTSKENVIEYLCSSGIDMFSCSGGGRCFEKDYQGNINPELSEIIREYEG